MWIPYLMNCRQIRLCCSHEETQRQKIQNNTQHRFYWALTVQSLRNNTDCTSWSIIRTAVNNDIVGRRHFLRILQSTEPTAYAQRHTLFWIWRYCGIVWEGQQKGGEKRGVKKFEDVGTLYKYSHMTADCVSSRWISVDTVFPSGRYLVEYNPVCRRWV